MILIVVCSRLPALGQPVLDIDEADYAVETAVWMNGGIPYVDFVEKKTLLMHSYFRAVFSIFGLYNMTAMHIMDMVVALLTVGGVFLFARQVLGEKMARWAALIYACFQSFYDLNDFLSTTSENVMNLFAIFAAFLFFRSLREERPWLLIVSGSLAGFSVLARQTGIALLPAYAVAFAWFWHGRGTRSLRRCLADVFLFSLGVAFPVLVHLGYLVLVGGLEGFIRWTWFENLRYASPVGPWPFVSRALAQGGKFFAATWALWGLASLPILTLRRRKPHRLEIVFLLSWVVCIVPMVSLGGRFYAHYFLQFVPPLAVLAAIGVVDIVHPWIERRASSRVVRLCGRYGGALVVFILPSIVFFILHVLQLETVKAEMGPSRAIAGWVESHTTSADRIFVWGHDSDIYFFSRRLPASRFIYCSYITGIKEGYESSASEHAQESNGEAWELLRQDFERHPPAVIVDLAPTNRRGYGAYPPMEQPFLGDYLRQQYTLAASLDGALMYMRR